MPLVVLGAGLQRTFAPRLLDAAHERSAALYWAERRRYVWMVAAGGVVYLVVVGIPYPANPMALLAPTAYVLGGLAALRVSVQLLQVSIAGYRPALLATGGEREILRAALAHGAIVLIVTAALAGAIGAYVIPASVLGGAAARGVLMRGAATPAPISPAAPAHPAVGCSPARRRATPCRVRRTAPPRRAPGRVAAVASRRSRGRGRA
jgi:hypothetical protein